MALELFTGVPLGGHLDQRSYGGVGSVALGKKRLYSDLKPACAAVSVRDPEDPVAQRLPCLENPHNGVSGLR